MTWRGFADISKSVFVEVAAAEYGINGRPTNTSRVSLLTGISRKEVARQRQLLEQKAEDAPPNKTTDATRVLSGWHQDAEFSSNGQPKKLRLDDGIGSFPALCRRYAADIPMVAMLKELKRVGAVQEDDDGQISALTRFYMPTQFDPQWILNAGGVFADLGNNINYNVAAAEGTPSRFLGRASDPLIAASAVPEFREFIEIHGQEFLERVDAWLSEHRPVDDENSEQTVRLGVGLFLIQGD